MPLNKRSAMGNGLTAAEKTISKMSTSALYFNKPANQAQGKISNSVSDFQKKTIDKDFSASASKKPANFRIERKNFDVDVVESFRKTGILQYNLSKNEMGIADYQYICSLGEIFLRKTNEVSIISNFREDEYGWCPFFYLRHEHHYQICF